MDPLVRSAQVSATWRNSVVTLDGCVRTETARHRVENDAWARFAVDKVINRIEVRA
jgi:osmotically-inducible protein OsmY